MNGGEGKDLNADRIVLRPESRLFIALSKAFDVFLLSVLWLLCCAPLVTAGASTAALYYASVKSVRRGRGGVLSNFFRCFRDNFKQATLLTLLYAAFAGWTYVLYRLAAAVSSAASWIGAVYPFAIAAFLLPAAMMAVYQFPVLSRFGFPLGGQLKTAFCMAVRHFPSTAAILGIAAGAAWAIYWCPPLLIVLPGAVSLLCSLFLERIFRKYMVRPADGDYGETDWCWE